MSKVKVEMVEDSADRDKPCPYNVGNFSKNP